MIYIYIYIIYIYTLYIYIYNHIYTIYHFPHSNCHTLGYISHFRTSPDIASTINPMRRSTAPPCQEPQRQLFVPDFDWPFEVRSPAEPLSYTAMRPGTLGGLLKPLPSDQTPLKQFRTHVYTKISQKVGLLKSTGLYSKTEDCRCPSVTTKWINIIKHQRVPPWKKKTFCFFLDE